MAKTKTKAKNRRKKTRECWLFLDCQVMTGHPPSMCPNFKTCKEQALTIPNKTCKLPYQVRHFNANDPFPPNLKTELCVLTVLHNKGDESRAAGWLPAQQLFYAHHDCQQHWWDGQLIQEIPRALTVGYEETLGHTPFHFSMPPEAEKWGFARAVSLPYKYKDLTLFVSMPRDSHTRQYPSFYEQAGWYPAVELPYYMDSFEGLEYVRVCFAPGDPDNAEAVAAGWYPPEYIPSN